MKVIGITGGIGMGKSTAGDLLQKRGFPVIDTDIIARQIVEPGRPALAEITATFGNTVIGADGSLLRGELAKIVFTDSLARKRLEEILHPRIRARWQAEVEQWRGERHPFGFVLIPLLFETNAASSFDATICVACSRETQITRLKNRGWGTEEIERRKAAQWPIQKKMDASTFVVWTDTTLDVHANQLNVILGI